MKTGLILTLFLLCILACGCMAGTPAAATALPDLTGTWTGPMKDYDEYAGFTDYPNFTVELHITEQQGRLFTGTIVFALENGNVSSTGIAGAISEDGRTSSLVEKEWGYCSGRIVAKDAIEITYLNDHTPYSAAIDTFRRV